MGNGSPGGAGSPEGSNTVPTGVIGPTSPTGPTKTGPTIPPPMSTTITQSYQSQ